MSPPTPQGIAQANDTCVRFLMSVNNAKRWQDVVRPYARAIRKHAREMGPDSVWPQIHKAIRERWAKSTQERIKCAAWKIVNGTTQWEQN